MRVRRVLGRAVSAVAVVVTAMAVAAPASSVSAAAPPSVAAAAAPVAAAAPAAAWVTSADPVWSTPVTAIPDRGQPSDVSCPTTTWCMAVDLSGQVLTFNGSTWSSPKRIFPKPPGPPAAAVSCPTTTFCLAVTATGYGVYRSGVWTVVQSAMAPFRAVDCYSATRCALIRGDVFSSHAMTYWNGSSLTSSVNMPWAYRVDAVACVSATTCHAIGLETKGGAIALRSSGATWVASYLGLTSRYAALDLSCTSASFCLATSGNSYRTWRWNGGSWTGAAETQDGILLDVETVACTSSSSCTAVGDRRVGRWNGSSWTVRDLYPLYGASYAMDCATASTCVVVDDRGRWWRGGGSTWTAAKSFDPTSGGPSDLSCPSPAFCLATDRLGNAFRWNGSAWSGASRLGTLPSSVECLATTWCMTVDSQQGSYRLWTGAWGPAVTFDLVNYWPMLSCGSTTTCFVFGLGEARRWDGRSWGARTRLFSTDVTALRCVGSRFCMAMDANGVMRTWNGTSWSTARSTGVAYPSDLTCTSSTFCMVMSYGNLYSTWNGSTWAVRRTLPDAVTALQCTATTQCTGAGYDGSAWRWGGSAWVRMAGGPGVDTVRLECRSTGCVALGETRSSRTL